MSASESPCEVRKEVWGIVDREIRHLKELVERTASENNVALGLQRTEYLRRLDELNNAHARAEAAVRATVPRETFDVFVANYNRWREEVLAETGNIKASAATRDRIFYVAITLTGLVMSGVGIWMAFKSR